MENEAYNKYKFKVLWKLYHHHYIGKRHTPKENIPKGLPPHEYGACQAVVEDLIREGLLISKKTGHGLDVSLNPKLIKEIKEFLDKYSPILG